MIVFCPVFFDDLMSWITCRQGSYCPSGIYTPIQAVEDFFIVNILSPVKLYLGKKKG